MKMHNFVKRSYRRRVKMDFFRGEPDTSARIARLFALPQHIETNQYKNNILRPGSNRRRKQRGRRLRPGRAQNTGKQHSVPIYEYKADGKQSSHKSAAFRKSKCKRRTAERHYETGKRDGELEMVIEHARYIENMLLFVAPYFIA